MSEFVWSEYSVEDLEELARRSALSRFSRLEDDFCGEIDENSQLADDMDGFVLPPAPSIPTCSTGTSDAVEESIRELRAVMASYRTSINSAASRYMAMLDSKQDEALDGGLCDMLRRDQAGLAMEMQMRRELLSAADIYAAKLHDIQRTAVEYISKELGDSDLPPEVEKPFEALVEESDPNLATVRLRRLMKNVDTVVSTRIAVAAEAASSKANKDAQLVADAIADELRAMNCSISSIEVTDDASSQFYGIPEDSDHNAIKVHFDHERKTLSLEVGQISGQGEERTPVEILKDDEAAVSAWCGEDGHQNLSKQLKKRGIVLGHTGEREWRGQALPVFDSPLLAQALEERRRKKSRKRGKKELRYRTRKRD